MLNIAKYTPTFTAKYVKSHKELPVYWCKYTDKQLVVVVIIHYVITMKREAPETLQYSRTQHQLEKDIRELMVSLEKQNVLLWGYYEKIINKSLQKVQKGLRMEADKL